MLAMARIGISLDTEQMRRFEALAALENKRPATLAAELVKRYMSAHAKDIDLILHAKDKYESSVAQLRKTQMASDET